MSDDTVIFICWIWISVIFFVHFSDEDQGVSMACFSSAICGFIMGIVALIN